MSVLLTGTLAVDHIAEVVDGFNAGDLNGKLGAPRAHWGGCGMNLAYGFAQANEPALPWVFYGGDIPRAYVEHIKLLERSALNLSALCEQPEQRCAAAYIFTRDDGSQLTGFYPGTTRFQAPDDAQKNAIDQCSAWLAGPEDDDTLLARLPFVKDSTELYWMPGQYAEVTRHNVLEPMLARTPNLLVNEKEWNTLRAAVGAEVLDSRVGAVFVTRGAAAMRYRLASSQQFQEVTTPPAGVVDPTGCGDAFYSTLIAGLTAKIPVESAIATAQLRAASCLSSVGAQQYQSA